MNGKKLIIGCVHLKPMPGTPFYNEGDLEGSLEKAIKDVKALKEGGANGCIIQTVDKVFPATDDTDYVRVACMSVIGHEAKKLAGPDFMVGVQIMWNCITPSLAAAKACHADFTRCSALIGRSESPYGVIEGQPLKVMNYRRSIDAENVEMIAELAGYHFISKDGYNKEELLKRASDALKVGASAVEVLHKDEEINNRMVQELKNAFPDIVVILGGGTDVQNAASKLKYADGAIVGACFENGNWSGPVCKETVQAYVKNVRAIEGKKE